MSIADLAAHLRELVTDYPADGESCGPVASVVLTGIDGDRHEITLQPGQVDWLTRLLADELTTCREAHQGGTGECGHCGALPGSAAM